MAGRAGVVATECEPICIFFRSANFLRPVPTQCEPIGIFFSKCEPIWYFCFRSANLFGTCTDAVRTFFFRSANLFGTCTDAVRTSFPQFPDGCHGVGAHRRTPSGELCASDRSGDKGIVLGLQDRPQSIWY